MMMDVRVIFSVGAAISIIVAVKAYNNRKKKKKDKDFDKFRTQLENTTEPEKINQAVINSAFDPNYWKEQEAIGKTIIEEKAAIEIAKQIAGAWNAGTFWDDLEDEVYRAFEDHRLKTFADVSRVADAYRSKKVLEKDLWKHLNSKLSTTEFARVKNIVVKKIAQ